MTGGGARVSHPGLDRHGDEAARALQAIAGGERGLRLAESYRRALGSWPADWPYNRVPAEVLAARDELKREGGSALVAAVHRFVILASVPSAGLPCRPGRTSPPCATGSRTPSRAWAPTWPLPRTTASTSRSTRS